MTPSQRHDVAYVLLALLAGALIVTLIRIRRNRRIERRNNRSRIDLGAGKDRD
jgi:hypothetical protein